MVIFLTCFRPCKLNMTSYTRVIFLDLKFYLTLCIPHLGIENSGPSRWNKLDDFYILLLPCLSSPFHFPCSSSDGSHHPFLYSSSVIKKHFIYQKILTLKNDDECNAFSLEFCANRNSKLWCKQRHTQLHWINYIK